MDEIKAEDLVKAIPADEFEPDLDDLIDYSVDAIAPALASLMAVLDALLAEGVDTDERELL